jgi:predicted  nucleic acid-binding Zn-ribbon protein
MGQDKIELLRSELAKHQEQKHEISTQLLDPGWKKEEVKALLDRGAELDQKIEALENEIRELEHPGQKPGEPINPWMGE